jgi:hypothetical protein
MINEVCENIVLLFIINSMIFSKRNKTIIILFGSNYIAVTWVKDRVFLFYFLKF